MTPHGEPHNSLDQAGTEPKTPETTSASGTGDGLQRVVDRGVPPAVLSPHRAHTAIGGPSPTDRVHNLAGKYT